MSPSKASRVIQSRYSQLENSEIVHRLVHGLHAPAGLAHQERRRRGLPSSGAAVPAPGSCAAGSASRAAAPPGTPEEIAAVERGKARDSRVGGGRSRAPLGEAPVPLRSGMGRDDGAAGCGGRPAKGGGGERSAEPSLPHSGSLRSARRSRGGETRSNGVRT